MSAHTPGPWEVDGGIRGYEFAVIKPTATEGPRAGSHLAIADIPEATRDGEAEANARLIAAAPELLAAVQRCLRLLEQREGHEAIVDSAIQQCRAAVAKAEGAK